METPSNKIYKVIIAQKHLKVNRACVFSEAIQISQLKNTKPLSIGIRLTFGSPKRVKCEPV